MDEKCRDVFVACAQRSILSSQDRSVVKMTIKITLLPAVLSEV